MDIGLKGTRGEGGKAGVEGMHGHVVSRCPGSLSLAAVTTSLVPILREKKG